MSTAHATITFGHVDPDRAATILAVLRVHRSRFEYTDAVVAPLQLFREYGLRDAPTMICTQLATLIRRLDPAAVFTIRQDLTGEFVGHKLVSVPELGDHMCALDEEGSDLIAGHQLRRTLDAARGALAAGADTADAFAELDRLAGGPWQRHLALLAAMGGTHLRALTTRTH